MILSHPYFQAFVNRGPREQDLIDASQRSSQKTNGENLH